MFTVKSTFSYFIRVFLDNFWMIFYTQDFVCVVMIYVLRCWHLKTMANSSPSIYITSSQCSVRELLAKAIDFSSWNRLPVPKLNHFLYIESLDTFECETLMNIDKNCFLLFCNSFMISIIIKCTNNNIYFKVVSMLKRRYWFGLQKSGSVWGYVV